MTVQHGWRRTGTALERELSFRDNDEALQFVDRLAEVAVDYQRRPEIRVSGNRVQLVIANLHHAGVTEAELRLAAKVDAVLAEHHPGVA
jgi:4a-hydroxytetrahydrobiopterin dehydratase